MAHHAHEPQVTVLPPDKAKIKKLWTVALYLLLITIVEFIIAFSVPRRIYHRLFRTAWIQAT